MVRPSRREGGGGGGGCGGDGKRKEKEDESCGCVKIINFLCVYFSNESQTS